MKNILLLLFSLIAFPCIAFEPYDSLVDIRVYVQNHRSDIDAINSLIGQRLYFSTRLNALSYYGNIEWKNNRDKLLSDKEVVNLSGSYFDIVDVTPSGSSYEFSLKKLDDGEVYYYSHYAPFENFIGQGYIDKMRCLYLGKDLYYWRPKEMNAPKLCYFDGNIAKYPEGYRLFCNDVRIRYPENAYENAGVIIVLIDSLDYPCYFNLGFDNAGKNTYREWCHIAKKSALRDVLYTEKQHTSHLNTLAKTEEHKKERARKEAEANAKQLEVRRKEMISKYGKTNGTAIADGKIRIGMTKDMCKDAWGEPDDIHTTTTAYGKYEQWIYGKYEIINILFFENGRLKLIQD